MDLTVDAPVLNRSSFITGSNSSFLVHCNRQVRLSRKINPKTLHFTSRTTTQCIGPFVLRSFFESRFRKNDVFGNRSLLRSVAVKSSEAHHAEDSVASSNIEFVEVLVKRGLVLAAIICLVLVLGCRRVLAVEGVMNAGYGVLEQGVVLLRSSWPKVLQVLWVFKEQGLILAALLGLSAFFSMAETSITTLWPWKVRELAEKESENGVFKMLSSDITRFLTTIFIGTTVVNIGATALVTDAATAIFGQAGVSAATGVMTVAVLLLTEITPKSIAVHNATEVARFVVRPVAWLSLI